MDKSCNLGWDSDKVTFVERVYVGVQGRNIQPLFGESKAIPIQAWRVPEGFRRLRLPDFMAIGT
jgi:hypothetical protein